MASRSDAPTAQTLQLASRLAVPALVLLILGLWIITRISPPAADRTHESAPHGGTIASLAGDRFHVEAVIERGGTLRLFLLGRDTSQVIDVERQSLTAYVSISGEVASQSVRLEPTSQSGDSPGRTSQFVGQLPGEFIGEGCNITIPGLQIAGGRYHVRFALSGPHEPAMPAKVADDEARELYLVPAGRYTDADIAANGRQTASQRFPAFRPKHDVQPQPGDRLCPITRTKANPQCQWTIGGQVYDFCCPPCIDEFVRLAKESPDEISGPDAYVKR